MAFIFSSLLKIFQGSKKRHNTENDLQLSKPLTRDEFLRVYESMPEASRAALFATLSPKQKNRLLSLLSGSAEPARVQPEAPDWDAEDFLPEKDERKIARLRQLKEFREIKTVFSAIEEHPAETLAEILTGESAAITAMVLVQLTQKYASQVLKSLPELSRGEIVRAMASERQVVNEALVALAKKINARLAEIPKESAPRVDGVKHVNEILKLLGVDEAERITREVIAVDAKLGGTLEKNRYTFDDLTHLNARDFRTLFSSMPDETLWARALKAVDQGQRKALLGKLPLKRAGLIAQAMGEIRTTRLDSIDKARSKILAQALRLAARHEISFAGNGRL